MPGRFGKWQTLYSRFQRWQQDGIWDQVMSALQRQADAAGNLDWALHLVASTVVRAHQHAAGATGGCGGGSARTKPCGFSSKLHLGAERGGQPLILVLTGGEQHDQPILPALMERGAVKRLGRGRPHPRPHAVVGDKGYSSTKVRHYLRGRQITAVIPKGRPRAISQVRPRDVPRAQRRGAHD
ncbi:MAG: IS5 family transposase [Chloroflexi bacterium]|nr:IS5 family transposase [Chloroflexota bacterium]